MKVLSLKDLPIVEKMVCTVGNFDGFHAGHIKILEKLKSLSKETGFKSAVLTFSPHPREFFTGEKLCKIVNLETKKEFLYRQGIDYLILIPFDKNFANLSKDEFINFLKSKINCKYVVVGNDWRFGRNREGNVSFAKDYGEKIGINFIGIDEEKIKGKKISSSLLRELLRKGDIKKVNKILGRIYCIKGEVVKGKGLGKKINFPTINLEIEDNLCLKEGVYIGYVELKGKKYKSVINFGYRPTVDGKEKIMEVHIIEDTKDFILDKNPKVYFLHYLREEKKFNSIDELKNQIKVDVLKAKEYFQGAGNEVFI